MTVGIVTTVPNKFRLCACLLFQTVITMPTVITLSPTLHTKQVGSPKKPCESPSDHRSPAHSVHGPTQCTPKSKNTKNSTLLYTIKMDPIDAALAALELQDPPNYTRTAKEFNVIRSTLSRRHRQITRAREDATEMKSLLLIQQEKTLLRYINLLTKRGLPPTP